MSFVRSREDRLAEAPGQNLQTEDTFVSGPRALAGGPWPNGVVRRT